MIPRYLSGLIGATRQVDFFGTFFWAGGGGGGGWANKYKKGIMHNIWYMPYHRALYCVLGCGGPNKYKKVTTH